MAAREPGDRPMGDDTVGRSEEPEDVEPADPYDRFTRFELISMAVAFLGIGGMMAAAALNGGSIEARSAPVLVFYAVLTVGLVGMLVGYGRKANGIGGRREVVKTMASLFITGAVIFLLQRWLF